MSRMLTFHDALWASARDRAAAGRRADALGFLTPLLGADVPHRHRLLANRLAARLQAASERYKKSRQHLYEADRLDPGNAEIQFEIGCAFEADPYGCDRRAARRFRSAVWLKPEEAKYRAALGRALIRTNRVKAGVKQLKAAAATAPADAGVLRVVLDGLTDAGRAELALTLIATAKFQAPVDKRIAKLWADAKFAAAGGTQPKPTKIGTGPCVLPFLRLVNEGPTGDVYRRDAGEIRKLPHIGRFRSHRAEPG